jgi:hypothetical protein
VTEVAELAARVVRCRMQVGDHMNRVERSAYVLRMVQDRNHPDLAIRATELQQAKAMRSESKELLAEALRDYWNAGGRDRNILRRWTP